MKIKNIIIILIYFVYTFGFSQQSNCTLLYSINNAKNVNIVADTLYFEKSKAHEFYFYNNQFFLNKKKILCFENIHYYMEMAYIQSGKNKYLYIYPLYNGQAGPYIWYGNGIAIELKNKKYTIKENLDYLDNTELCKAIKPPKYKKISSNKCIASYYTKE